MTYESRFTQFKCNAPRPVRKIGAAGFRWLSDRVSRFTYATPKAGTPDKSTRCCRRRDDVIACDVSPDFSGTYTETSHPGEQLIVKHKNRAEDWRDLTFQFGKNGNFYEISQGRWSKDSVSGESRSCFLFLV